MADSLMDYLTQNRKSGIGPMGPPQNSQGQLMWILEQILGRRPQGGTQRVSTGLTGTPTGVSEGTSAPGAGTTVAAGGDTQYPYETYPKPYFKDPEMVTARGIQLQKGPMRSLRDIARESDILPGTQEIGKILTGYRDPYIVTPMSTPAGMSWHHQGLAIDAGWWNKYPELVQALQQAGWNRFDPETEPWHWSYGVTG